MDVITNQKYLQILVVLAGIILSSMSGWFVFEKDEKAIISEFHKDVNERAASLYREVTINFETLHALAIIFNGETIPAPQIFSREAKKILSRYDDVQALEWIPRIIHSQRATYEAKQRKEFPAFEITERKKQGHMVTARERKEYFPVYYVEPFIGNEAALGFDLASNPIRLKALETARDTATPQATASITLVQESEQQKAFLAFLPIFKGSPATLDKRRLNLRGFVLGVYRIGDIFARSALSDESLGIEMTLVDETSSSALEIIYIYKLQTGFTANKSIVYRKELPRIWGRKWSLIASPSQSYIAVRRDILPLVIFVAGLVFTFLIALYIHIISKRTATIQKIVIEKTNELTAANKNLKLLSRTDGLTGLANRRYMDEFLDLEWLRSVRNNSSLSFILIDIDYFKLYNDNYGHPEGDECLKKVTMKLKSLVNRPGDLVARYGGEEIAFVLAETTDAKFVAEKCRRKIEELQIPHQFSKCSNIVTISVGYCTVTPKKATDPSSIIETTDKALYKAKKSGRNRVEVITLDS